MGFYKKLETAFGEKAAKPVVAIFVFLKYLPSKIKKIFSIILNYTTKPFVKEQRIFLLPMPDYGNLGDQLIALAEICWIKDFFPGNEMLVFDQNSLTIDKGLRLFLSQVTKNDLIFFQGGGNLNNLYLISEKIRRSVIKKCPKNKIVLFQQSINLSPPINGISIKEETERIYNSHKKFTIITREETSYRNANESFPKIKILKYPDMATYLFGKIGPSNPSERHGIIFCLRKDDEKFYSNEKIRVMTDKISKIFDVTFSDTHIGHPVSTKNRQTEIQKLIDSISKHKVMVTDRFHGVVFSILANTPCVVLRSADHKITDGVKWFKDVDGIFFAENIEDVPELVKKAEKYAPIKQPDFSHYFEKMYHEIN